MHCKQSDPILLLGYIEKKLLTWTIKSSSDSSRAFDATDSSQESIEDHSAFIDEVRGYLNARKNDSNIIASIEDLKSFYTSLGLEHQYDSIWNFLETIKPNSQTDNLEDGEWIAIFTRRQFWTEKSFKLSWNIYARTQMRLVRSLNKYKKI